MPLVGLYGHEITPQLVDDIGHLAMFCDSLSAMGPPCGPFHLENCMATHH